MYRKGPQILVSKIRGPAQPSTTSTTDGTDGDQTSTAAQTRMGRHDSMLLRPELGRGLEEHIHSLSYSFLKKYHIFYYNLFLLLNKIQTQLIILYI
jgi:hypothetical protein